RTHHAVHCGDLDQLRPFEPGDIRIIVEIDRTRGLGADDVSLKAGLGEDDGLRGGIDLERLQERVEVTSRLGIRERDPTRLHLRNETRDVVVLRSSRVIDEGVVLVVYEATAVGDGEVSPKAQRQCGKGYRDAPENRVRRVRSTSKHGVMTSMSNHTRR